MLWLYKFDRWSEWHSWICRWQVDHPASALDSARFHLQTWNLITPAVRSPKPFWISIVNTTLTDQPSWFNQPFTKPIPSTHTPKHQALTMSALETGTTPSLLLVLQIINEMRGRWWVLIEWKEKREYSEETFCNVCFLDYLFYQDLACDRLWPAWMEDQHSSHIRGPIM